MTPHQPVAPKTLDCPARVTYHHRRRAFPLLEAMRATRSVSLRQLVRGQCTFALALLPGWCYTCPDDEPTASVAPAVAYIDVLPPTISVSGSTMFELRVRLRDAADHVLDNNPSASAVSWTVLSGTGVTAEPPAAGARGYIKIIPPGVLPAYATVQASISGVPDVGKAQVTIVQEGTPANKDWLRGSHESKEPPTIALVDGSAVGGSWIDDSVHAFVRDGIIDKLECIPVGSGCGQVTALSRHRRIDRIESVVWKSAGCATVTFKTTADALPTSCVLSSPPPVVYDVPRVINVGVFVLVDPGDVASVLDQAVKEWDRARETFSDGWTGLTLQGPAPTAAGLGPVDVVVPIEADGRCRNNGTQYDVRRQLEVIGRIGAANFARDRITVAFVKSLKDFDQVNGVPYAYGPPGYACIWDSNNGVLILIGKDDRSISTLAHELGHALGLTHTDEMPEAPGLDASNLMWSLESSAYPSRRNGITLGQSFRMSLLKGVGGSGTVLQNMASPPPVIDCVPAMLPGPKCPDVRKDIPRQ